jgi:hypothetical protein
MLFVLKHLQSFVRTAPFWGNFIAVVPAEYLGSSTTAE